MRHQWTLIWLLWAIHSLKATRPVTNEDIRDAILSVVHMIRSSEDKLERHEYRERSLGEQLKKALSTIDKRQRLLDPVKGTLSRLDERLATVETILMQKDERERIQLQKTYDMVDQIHKSLPQLFEALKNDIITSFPKDETKEQQPLDVPSKNDFANLQKEIENKITAVSNNAIQNIEVQLSKLWEENKKNNQLHEHATENLENVKRHINNSEQVLEKYESKLAEYENHIDVIPTNYQAQNELMHTSLLQALEDQKNNVEKILSEVESVSTKIQNIPQHTDLQRAKNDTLQSLQQMKYEITHQTGNTVTLIDGKVKEIENQLEKNKEDIKQSILELGDMTALITGNVASSFDQLKSEIKALDKLEDIMIQTGDGVMDTKRRVEYGVHQILLEVGDLIKEHSKEMNSTIYDRFESFEHELLDKESGALANVTAKIGSDIDQVWRQIGIMYQQMTASSETLDKLQTQTDLYVNGSVSSMDTMRGKVGQITSRMLEVDDNLNYLLGRLSLVTQEFNQIKTGLGDALDQIKGSFETVQQKLRDAGPGPHHISSNEVNGQHADNVSYTK